MTSTDKNELGNMDAVNAQLRIPPFWADDVELWFNVLEAQFKHARITSEEAKYNAAIANIDKPYVRLIRDIVANPPESGQYVFLKNELIKRLGESDAQRLRKIVESEQIGDRTPSQFYRDLKSLATPAISDELIRTLWEGRLPVHVQHVLAAVQDKRPETLTAIA
ncbi:uncharacterized protein LOC117162592 [Bombus vancouverensis nearcticus]|uniref:uncharacterized protein LOC117162592 n=1 Tax=Bombus vancouverensis nearcticus TaxID=2705178 RepID=UPI00402B6A6B